MPVTSDELLAEARRIARPIVELRENGPGPLVALWRAQDEPRLSIDLGALTGAGLGPGIDAALAAAIAAVPRAGSLDVFAKGEPPRLHPQRLLERGVGGDPLFAHREASFPPLEALCRYGGPIVDAWAAGLGLTRADADHPNLYDSREGRAIEEAWQGSCALYVASAVVVLGGWHMRWPEDDEYERPGRHLLAWTFRDAEPWLEVWIDDGGRFETLERIT